MRYTLKNEYLLAEADSFGAELRSVRDSAGREYLWQADKKYWGRTSPVLFPFVGSLKNKEYHYQGKTYPMGQHGFARDMEHELVSRTENELWFCLKDNKETFVKYPFNFCLNIGYRLVENRIEVLWKVKNTGPNRMHFSIGAHPAFFCPIGEDRDKYGYSLYFEDAEEIRYHGNDGATGLALREDLILPLRDHKAEIVPGFFDRCTYMIEGRQTKRVGLVDKQGRMYVSMRFDTPLFALWSPEGKDAPFVCIEPWYGRCDAADFEGTLEEREYNNVLAPGDAFEGGYQMEFFQE